MPSEGASAVANFLQFPAKGSKRRTKDQSVSVPRGQQIQGMRIYIRGRLYLVAASEGPSEIITYQKNKMPTYGYGYHLIFSDFGLLAL